MLPATTGRLLPMGGIAQTAATRRLMRAVMVVVCMMIAMAVVGSIGPGGSEGEALSRRWIALADAVLRALPPAVAYLLGALGLGRLARPMFARAQSPWALQMVVGLAMMLTLSHALGWIGLLSGHGRVLVAMGIVGMGLALLAHQLVMLRAAGGPAMRISPLVWLGAPALAVLLVSSASPPGWLWDSEFGGYDALSYHLQLPQEWLVRGRLSPLEHNVYSFLPGYVEAAFLHVGALMDTPRSPTVGVHIGLTAGDGMGLLACQFLHAGLTIIAAWVTGEAARAAIRAAGIEPHSTVAARAAPVLAGMFVLATPWSVVVGSLAYNEMAMLALGAGAMLAALETSIRPILRGLLVGALVGVACGAKPTAMFMFAPSAGLAMIGAAVMHEQRSGMGRVPLMRVGLMLIACAGAGLLAISPWLVRNALACGNPVFPFFTSIFGDGHWSPEQAARYARGHAFDGSIVRRLSLIVMPDPLDPAGARHRGMMHPQWFAFFPAVVLAGAAACASRISRGVGMLLAAGLIAQALAWLFLTHVQSRFLMPTLVPGAMLFALAVASAGRDQRAQGVGEAPVRPRQWGRVAAGIAVVSVQSAALLVVFAQQRGGAPNRLLAAGPSEFTGEYLHEQFRAASSGEQQAFVQIAPSEVAVNLALPPTARVCLIGSGAPLYVRPPVLYATTWDTSAFTRIVAASPDEPQTWARSLRAMRIEAVLVDLHELDRLSRSGWMDPALDPARIAQWLIHHTTPLQGSIESGRGVFLLRAPGSVP